MQKYILTGGPGSGKSSIILALEQKGEYVLREAAEDYIRYRQACGEKTPWFEPDFQKKILELQTQREGRVPREAQRVFLDRGYADGIAYLSTGHPLRERLEQEARKAGYTKVFLIENLGGIETNGVRRENQEEALMLEAKLEDTYTRMGFQVVKIRPGKLDERVAELMSNLK